MGGIVGGKEILVPKKIAILFAERTKRAAIITSTVCSP